MEVLRMMRGKQRPDELTEKQWEALWMVSLNTITMKRVIARGQTKFAYFSPDGTNITSRIDRLYGKSCVGVEKATGKLLLLEKGQELLDPDKHTFAQRYRNMMPQIQVNTARSTIVETVNSVEISEEDFRQMVKAAGVNLPDDAYIHETFPIRLTWSTRDVKEDE